MNKTHEIIRYLAIAFAICIVLSIVQGIVGVMRFVTPSKEDKVTEIKKLDLKDESSESLFISLGATNLVVKIGDELKATTNNKNIIVKNNGNSLRITEKKHKYFNKNNYKLEITIPEDKIFDLVHIEAGAGKVDLSGITSKELELELGAGKVDIKDFDILNKTKIEAGAGQVNIKKSTFKNSKFDLGVGEVNIEANLVKKADIEAGIGSVNIYLVGSSEDYSFDVDKGLGSITIDGTKKDEGTYGEGENKIHIDGGIGSINVNFKD